MIREVPEEPPHYVPFFHRAGSAMLSSLAVTLKQLLLRLKIKV
jgi:hypothetical protein